MSDVLKYMLLVAMASVTCLFTEYAPAYADEPREIPSAVEGEALSQYTMGVFLLEDKSPRDAIPHLKAAWMLSEKDAKIGGKLAEAFFQAGDLTSCDAVLDDVIERAPVTTDVLLLKAKVRYLREEKEESLYYLEKIDSLFEPEFDATRLRAKVLLDLGRTDEAIDAYATAIDLDPNYPALHYHFAQLLRDSQRTAEAEESFRHALELEPRFSQAAFELFKMLIEDERYDDAESVLLRLIQNDGDNLDAVMTLGKTYFARNKFGDIIKLLEGRAEEGTLPDDGVMLLGRAHYSAKNYSKALEAFGGLYERSEKSAELARVLGEVSLKASQPDTSLAYFREAIEISPDDYRGYLSLFFASSPRFSGGEMVIDLPRSEQIELLGAAEQRLGKDDFNGVYMLGISYQSVDEFEKAENYLRRATELDPENNGALLNLAGALEKMGRYEDAEPYIARLHDRKPEDAMVCNFYGYLLALMGKNLDQAEQLIQTALRLDPDNGYYIDSLGWVFYMRGEYDKAIIELEKASSLVGDDPAILEHLGDAYRSSKRFREAVAAYKKSQDLQGENSTLLDKIDAARDRAQD